MPASSFQSIGLVVRQDIESHGKTISAIIDALHETAQLHVHYLDEEYNASQPDCKSLNELGELSDLIISLGGDGTLLSAAKALIDYDKPLLGINLGRLGFLADVSIQDFRKHVDEILAGQYTLENRFLIEGEVHQHDQPTKTHIAFNDIILHGFEAVRMIEYQLSSDDKLIHQQRSDGVIVATPTGSTAYSLSGGGPIVHPGLDALCVVPICPHTLSNRPIMLPASQTIEVSLVTDNTRAQISFDGHTQALIAHNDTVSIRRHSRSVKLLHPIDYDYFQILRAKLRWSTHY